jgi:hypothetical protein
MRFDERTKLPIETLRKPAYTDGSHEDIDYIAELISRSFRNQKISPASTGVSDAFIEIIEEMKKDGFVTLEYVEKTIEKYKTRNDLGVRKGIVIM